MTETVAQQNLRILHLEDNAADVALVEAVLESEQVPFSLKRVATKNDFEAELKSGAYNLILSDFSLPGFDGMAALNIAKSIAPATPFLFLSGTIGEERAVESLKNGAVDYILKDRISRLGSALRRAHDEAVQKTTRKELESRLMRNQRMENIGALAAGIAHDLNNVLAPILMTTELLADRITDPDDLRMLDLSRTSVRRGADLVKQILQFSRGTKGHEGSVNLRSAIEDVVKLIAKTFPPNIHVEAETAGLPILIELDPTEAHQILLNLCVNARDAMGETGAITIKARVCKFAGHTVGARKEPVTGEYAELIVTDTGSGIPPEIRARIFEPFFTTKPIGKGTGLGLSTVATILRDHNGFLELESEPGKGTTFRIFVPTTRQALEAAAPAEPTANVPGHGECLLLVDDELALVEMTREVLQANNYEVLTATSGHDALACLEEHSDKIAVVVTDLLMPGMNGPELIARVKAKYPNIATLCLSGSVSDESIPERSIQADITLHKPCPAAKLFSALESVLRKLR